VAIFKVVISVEGSPDLDDALDRAAEMGGYNYVDSTELVIVRAAGACKRCRQNQDPAAIPVHMQCFPAGTVVSGPKAVASVTRWYSGELVEIETRSGAVLASTPNHPILTVQGWVPMGLLEQGDQVVSQGGSERSALIEDVASSVGEHSMEVAVTDESFHGDGTGSRRATVTTLDCPVGDCTADASAIGLGEYSADQIVKVRRYPFSGYVYNLETGCGWYLASSVVVHNCNCRVELKDSGEIRSERI